MNKMTTAYSYKVSSDKQGSRSLDGQPTLFKSEIFICSYYDLFNSIFVRDLEFGTEAEDQARNCSY